MPKRRASAVGGLSCQFRIIEQQAEGRNKDPRQQCGSRVLASGSARGSICLTSLPIPSRPAGASRF